MQKVVYFSIVLLMISNLYLFRLFNKDLRHELNTAEYTNIIATSALDNCRKPIIKNNKEQDISQNRV